MAHQWQASEKPSDDRSVRCVQIVEHTYRKGIASLDELAKLTGAAAATIERDVACPSQELYAGCDITTYSGRRFRALKGVRPLTETPLRALEDRRS